MRPLDTCPGCVPRPELLGLLLAAGPLQRLVMLTRLQPDEPRLLRRLRTPRPRRTRRAIVARKPRLESHAVLGIRVREPGDALFARRASHHLPLPVHYEAPLVEPLAGAGLPAGVLGHRADDGHTVLTLAFDEDMSIGVTLVDQVLTRQQIAPLLRLMHHLDHVVVGGRRRRR